MPIVVCAICLAQLAQGKDVAGLNTGFYTMFEGTAYCEAHLPQKTLAIADLAPVRVTEEHGEPKKKRGRPPKQERIVDDDSTPCG